LSNFDSPLGQHPKSRTHHWTRICSLGEVVAMMGTGLTLVTNATKHAITMANVARLNTLLISPPVPFPFRVECGRLHFLDTSRHDDPVSTAGTVRAWGDRRRGAPSVDEKDEAYSAAIMFNFKLEQLPAFNMSSRCQPRLNTAAALTPIMLKTVS
jgi:hypothetical protein